MIGQPEFEILRQFDSHSHNSLERDRISAPGVIALRQRVSEPCTRFEKGIKMFQRSARERLKFHVSAQDVSGKRAARIDERFATSQVRFIVWRCNRKIHISTHRIFRKKPSPLGRRRGGLDGRGNWCDEHRGRNRGCWSRHRRGTLRGRRYRRCCVSGCLGGGLGLRGYTRNAQKNQKQNGEILHGCLRRNGTPMPGARAPRFHPCSLFEVRFLFGRGKEDAAGVLSAGLPCHGRIRLISASRNQRHL